jgi:hypothetical protein
VKKDLLGDFCRGGKIDTQQTDETNDHDFRSAEAGTLIPHNPSSDLRRRRHGP